MAIDDAKGAAIRAVGATILPNIGGWFGAFYVRGSIKTWYELLRLPSWRPPNAAFGPVWTVLYSGMGFASYLVWKDGGGFTGNAKFPLALYAGQLALNWMWTPIFFGARSILGGLIEISVLDLAAAGTAVAFFKVNKAAGLIFVPYLAWLGLATALNYVIWRDNCRDGGEKNL